jgi:calcineurin-like phosphoesterase family protein
MNYWFTSDWHLGHYNIIRYTKRPFKTTKEMDEAIIENLFSLIKKRDHLYFLGDMARSKKLVTFIVNKILDEGIEFYFIKGNHDKVPGFIKIYNLLSKNIDINYITMCHYPMISWNRSHFNSWSLHGHHHNDRISKLFPGKRMNVGVDVHNFKPVNFEDIKAYMAKQKDNWDLINDR